MLEKPQTGALSDIQLFTSNLTSKRLLQDFYASLRWGQTYACRPVPPMINIGSGIAPTLTIIL